MESKETKSSKFCVILFFGQDFDNILSIVGEREPSETTLENIEKTVSYD